LNKDVWIEEAFPLTLTLFPRGEGKTVMGNYQLVNQHPTTPIFPVFYNP